jgi:uncharacterized membrane protein YkvA (DUF1232 family)
MQVRMPTKTARRPPLRKKGRPKIERRAIATRRPLLTRAEMIKAVIELANTLAPADIGDLLAEERALRARAAQLGGAPGRMLRAQLDLALMCLRDHLKRACPQIPFYTISLLAAGVAYLGEKLDLIPDFMPRDGTLDDALVMAIAYELAEDGLRRYCTWKGVSLDLAAQR